MDGVEEFRAQGLTFAQVITLQGVYSLPKFENLLTVSGRKKKNMKYLAMGNVRPAKHLRVAHSI